MKNILLTLKEALQGEGNDYTSGSINRAIVLLSIPMIIEMIGESLFAVFDAYYVSKLGVEAVATVGLTEAVITIVYAVSIGLSMAGTAVVARRIGEKNRQGAANAAAQAILMAVTASVVLGILGVIFAEDILRAMGGTEKMIQSGLGYTRVAFGSNVVIMLLFLLNGIFRGAGDASLAMYTLGIANFMNILLDPIFIFGIGPFEGFGVQGAAIATSIGRGVGVLFQVALLLRGVGVLKLNRQSFRTDFAVIKNLISIGTSGMLQFAISSLSWIFIMRVIAELGDKMVAGYTIAIRLIIFTILPAWGIANAAATLVGQNLGAGKPDRAEASVWRAAFYNMIFLFVVSVIFSMAAYPLMKIFTTDENVIQAGILSLRIICAGYVFFAYGMVISQSFNGAGDTRTPMFVNFFCFWLIEIPISYILGIYMDYGIAGVCLAIAGSETLMAIICIVLFRRGKWKTIAV